MVELKTNLKRGDLDVTMTTKSYINIRCHRWCFLLQGDALAWKWNEIVFRVTLLSESQTCGAVVR